MCSKLILATRNPHKLLELRAILTPLIANFDPDSIQSAQDFDIAEPVENEVTFAGNALIKARQIASALGVPALADDSGICVDVLGGAPGVFSARWSGKHGDDAANLELLLAQLRDVPDEHRSAHFTCAAALVHPDGREWVKEGKMLGLLRRVACGANGFGYDPIFQPQGYTVTSAQLDADEKNRISHRWAAFTALAPIISRILEG